MTQLQRTELKKWFAVCKDRREKMMALRIWKKREPREEQVFTFTFDNLSWDKAIKQQWRFLTGSEED